MEARPIGGQWLKEHPNLVNYTMTHESYIAGTPSMRVSSKGNIEQDFTYKYALATENALHHVEFYLKYDDLNLDFLQAVFQKVTAAEVLDFLNEAPASKQARKIGILYEFLTDTKLSGNGPFSANKKIYELS